MAQKETLRCKDAERRIEFKEMCWEPDELWGTPVNVFKMPLVIAYILKIP